MGLLLVITVYRPRAVRSSVASAADSVTSSLGSIGVHCVSAFAAVQRKVHGTRHERAVAEASTELSADSRTDATTAPGRSATASVPGESATNSAAAAQPTGGDQPMDSAPFDRVAAFVAIRDAVAAASRCKGHDQDAPAGRVTVTFLPSGNVGSAVVGGDVAATSIAACVAQRFERAHVPPFSGPAVTITKSFVLR